MVHECWHCGEEVSQSRLSHETKRAAKESGQSVGSLDPEKIICISCAIGSEDPEDWSMLGGHTSEVWKWNLSGLTLDPGQKVIIALNY